MGSGGKQPRDGLRLDDANVGQRPALLNDVVAQVRDRHARPYRLPARHESPASGNSTRGAGSCAQRTRVHVRQATILHLGGSRSSRPHISPRSRSMPPVPTAATSEKLRRAIKPAQSRRAPRRAARRWWMRAEPICISVRREAAAGTSPVPTPHTLDLLAARARLAHQLAALLHRARVRNAARLRVDRACVCVARARVTPCSMCASRGLLCYRFCTCSSEGRLS